MKTKYLLYLSAAIGVPCAIWLFYYDWKIAIGVIGLATANNLLKFKNNDSV